MLTNATVKAAAPRSHAYKLADGRGLFLFVTVAGAKSWRLKYRFGRKEKLMTFGLYPDVSLSDARIRCDQARAQLNAGVDPMLERQHSAELERTFEQTAREWHEARAPAWSPAHSCDVLASLDRHVFPAIGAKRLADIGPVEILEFLQDVEIAGAAETAKRLRQRISMVFRFAIARGRAETDPAASLAGELAGGELVDHHAALLEVNQARALFASIDAAETTIAAIAHQVLALTTVRMKALRWARWSEFEGVDWSTDARAPDALWRIPAARMKLKRAKKLDSNHDHVIPLSPTAVQLLRRLRQISGAGDLVFPGRRHGLPIGEGAIGAVIRATPFAGRHVPHGWRASFSTIMNEWAAEHGRDGDRAAIDRTLAHSPKEKVEAAYNRAQLLARRRQLLETWAELLTSH